MDIIGDIILLSTNERHKMTTINKTRQLGKGGQMTLQGVVSVFCECGCGQSFMATKTPRMRQYINDTHKKRAARKRKEEQRIKLTPKGWAYLATKDDEELAKQWEHMTRAERELIALVCNMGISPFEIKEAYHQLFVGPAPLKHLGNI